MRCWMFEGGASNAAINNGCDGSYLFSALYRHDSRSRAEMPPFADSNSIFTCNERNNVVERQHASGTGRPDGYWRFIYAIHQYLLYRNMPYTGRATLSWHGNHAAGLASGTGARCYPHYPDCKHCCCVYQSYAPPVF